MKSRQARAQARTVVYAGKVGAKMKSVTHKMPSKITRKLANKCKDGPMKGHFLYLVSSHTLPISYRGETGRYVSGQWETM